MKKVLVVAAHPDDEVLGIGGTILKHNKQGDDVYCLIAAQGMAARNQSKKELKKLHEQCMQSVDILGIKKVFFLNFPDNKMDSVPLLDIVQKFEQIITKVKPDIIYTHHENDLNVDHRLCFQAVNTACRPCNKDGATEIYTFETLSCTEWQWSQPRFAPNTYIDISTFIKDKIKALKAYKSEVAKFPHPRSEEGIKTLAKYRGMESGLKYAEALCLVRRVIG